MLPVHPSAARSSRAHREGRPDETLSHRVTPDRPQASLRWSQAVVPALGPNAVYRIALFLRRRQGRSVQGALGGFAEEQLASSDDQGSVAKRWMGIRVPCCLGVARDTRSDPGCTGTHARGWGPRAQAQARIMRPRAWAAVPSQSSPKSWRRPPCWPCRGRGPTLLSICRAARDRDGALRDGTDGGILFTGTRGVCQASGRTAPREVTALAELLWGHRFGFLFSIPKCTSNHLQIL
mmetsp:Transcript_51967/g.137499  ORF Transcript_51967/g.137499 Transcript_51967/m.137499 type:complete len:236 (-) Transcript_51967:458-1165(-)